MGFWDAWNAGGASQGDLNQAFENGKKQGHNDMARWCNNLQDLVLEEAAMSVGQRVVLDLTLDALRKADPMHWLLVRENRLRIAGAVRDKALKDYTYTGISTPNGAVYHKMQNGFLEKRVITDGEVVGVVRKHGEAATAMTMGEVEFTDGFAGKAGEGSSAPTPTGSPTP
ncbi:MAG: hypothetical protein IPH39_17950 [Sulfuritalea sp.]|nr:hypothetical protein [Sulfuritalea sp.]MBK8119788.1 hypothetical protein [Sulfuritalea sp.]MBK9351779.1 hypothetical protein [Sulfuritalea sp.]